MVQQPPSYAPIKDAPAAKAQIIHSTLLFFPKTKTTPPCSSHADQDAPPQPARQAQVRGGSLCPHGHTDTLLQVGQAAPLPFPARLPAFHPSRLPISLPSRSPTRLATAAVRYTCAANSTPSPIGHHHHYQHHSQLHLHHY
ncbi:hypothetical protein E2C01_070747 [Portunus trituberculatus]|uniref:Uncharacterized protein n=1 Tax=Portunus trituberculatus TaxID=210409 RepID=A0A5B7I4F9_PORTR|nr:hypothetical protein [Portunus trituberculatus]